MLLEITTKVMKDQGQGATIGVCLLPSQAQDLKEMMEEGQKQPNDGVVIQVVDEGLKISSRLEETTPELLEMIAQLWWNLLIERAAKERLDQT